MRSIILFNIIIFIVASCVSKNVSAKFEDTGIEADTVYLYKNDTIFVHDTITVAKDTFIQYDLLLGWKLLDYDRTKRVLNRSLATGSIDTPPYYDLFARTDLEYFPYYHYILSHAETAPRSMYHNLPYYEQLCAHTIDDIELFNLGKNDIKKYCNNSWNDEDIYQYPAEYKPGGYVDDLASSNLTIIPTRADSLRVDVIAHHSREALKKLEDHYFKNNDSISIAIYYKILLDYEGFGDLAEKYYNVISPHFKEMPELRITAREILLRAAICDGNKRAQELCDSLGYSICDYRKL